MFQSRFTSIISADLFLTRALVVLGYSLWQSQEAHLLGTHFCLSFVPCVLSICALLILNLGREYVQLLILVVIKFLAAIMAPIGMKHIFLEDLYEFTQVSLLFTLKPRGKVLSFDPGFGSCTFFWVL